MNDDRVDFYNYLFQPETCEETNEQLHEREDDCHVLKRITGCLWFGSIPGIDLPCFNVFHDPDTGLTYEELTGKQKQSVPHCEEILFRGILEYLDDGVQKGD